MGFAIGLKVCRSLMANSSMLVVYLFLMGAFLVQKMLWGIVETFNSFEHPMHWTRKF